MDGRFRRQVPCWPLCGEITRYDSSALKPMAATVLWPAELGDGRGEGRQDAQKDREKIGLQLAGVG